MLKEAKRYIALQLARKLAGGSHRLVFDLYDRYQDLSNPVEHHQRSHPARQAIEQSEQNIKDELVLVLRDERIRQLFLGELPARLTTRVERVRKEDREKRDQGLKLAFAHYALLAQWAEHTAQEYKVDLTEDQQMLLFAMQHVAVRIFGDASSTTE